MRGYRTLLGVDGIENIKAKAGTTRTFGRHALIVFHHLLDDAVCRFVPRKRGIGERTFQDICRNGMAGTGCG